jgi:hypothetical protein
MLNFNEVILKSPDYSLVDKIKSIRYPNMYHVDDIGDYLNNKDNITFDWYKKIPFPSELPYCAYVFFSNVGLKRIGFNDDFNLHIFCMHDSSGEDIIYWGNYKNTIKTLKTFEEMQKKEGLKDNDWLFSVLVRYLISYNLPTIYSVNKFNFSNKVYKDSIKDKVNNFFPTFKPDFQISF